jgi:hypothetical protein
MVNANQPLDSLFNLNFINLAGFKEVAFLKKDDEKITLQAEMKDNENAVIYRTIIGKNTSTLHLETLKPKNISLTLDEISFPYAYNKSVGTSMKDEVGTIKITWNGSAPTITPEQSGAIEPVKQKDTVNEITTLLNLPLDEFRRVDFLPLRRGFARPIYSSAPMASILSEEEVATLIATDRDLEGRVDYYIERIVNRNFQARTTSLGSANFQLQTKDRDTALVLDLVGEGFGTNQLVYILAKVLRKDFKTICIEEPEIHIHPEAIIKLVDAFIDIYKNENRNLIITTHSEHLVATLLNRVGQGKIKPEEVSINYVYKEGKESKIEQQEVNEKGQAKGGLKAFYDAQLQITKDLFSISEVPTS